MYSYQLHEWVSLNLSEFSWIHEWVLLDPYWKQAYKVKVGSSNCEKESKFCVCLCVCVYVCVCVCERERFKLCMRVIQVCVREEF